MIQYRSLTVTGFPGAKFQGVQLIRQVAIYCRVSTADQSCERQERDLLAYAKRAGFEVAGVWKEIATGDKKSRPERQAVMALAQDRRIDGILVTELTRWGRSTLDLVKTLHDLQAWNVSLIAQTGLQFDLSTPQGKLIASIMASLAEFERDLLSERIRSGIAAAKAKGKKFGRKPGDRPKSDRLASKVCQLLKEGRSYRVIAKELNLSKTTVMGIVHRKRAAENADQ
jgi:DNA invertase Pin-like site-specific DNA recombinase